MDIKQKGLDTERVVYLGHFGTRVAPTNSGRILRGDLQKANHE
jgi:hypothetical protein